MEKKQNSSFGLLLTMQRWSWGEGGCQLLSTAALIFLSRLHLLNPTSTSNNLVMKKTETGNQCHPRKTVFQRSSCWIFRVQTIHRRRSCQTDNQPKTGIIRNRRKWIYTSVRDFLHKSREEEKEGASFNIFCCSFISPNSLLACSIYFTWYWTQAIDERNLEMQRGKNKNQNFVQENQFCSQNIHTSGEEENEGIRFQ